MNVRVLKNGKIYTGYSSRPWVDALAIAGERIVAWGDAALTWQEVAADVDDLDGATVVPGLTDAHVHLMWYGLSLQEVNLRDVSWEAFLDRVATEATRTPPGGWIRGRGWDQNLWPNGRFPTAADLDAVAPHNPVLLIAKNAHAAVANSAALAAAGLDVNTPDPEHGRIGREPDGTPNGMLFERAIVLVQDAVPAPTVTEVVEALSAAQERLLAVGLTGVHDVDDTPAFAAFQSLRRQARLKVRVVKYLRRHTLSSVIETGLRSGYGDLWLRFGGLKLFADGALGSRTAALFEPYEGEPENRGGVTLEPAHLKELAHRAAANGVATAIHAIGDRTNRLVLDVLAEVAPLDNSLRHRIEHVQLIAPEDQPRLAALGLVASMQPIHAAHDQEMASRYWGDRAQHAYAWRALLDAGTVLAFGSDAPIEQFDPWPGLYAAVTRRHEVTGAPGPEGWYPEQRLSLPEAFRGFSWGAAYAAGLETELGILRPGFLADLVVLNHDIFELPPEALLETKVQRVMVGGAWRWRAS
jgi:hypothetical protein